MDNRRRDCVTGRFLPTHGLKHSRLYAVWCAMKERCTNPNNKSFKHYGAKGISVCHSWADDFQSFERWARRNGYEDGLTIDRINNGEGYFPNNCRWVTTAQQNRNYSKNRMITYNGETLCLSDMADKYGVNRATVLFRLKSGKTIEQALSPIDGRTIRWNK